MRIKILAILFMFVIILSNFSVLGIIYSDEYTKTSDLNSIFSEDLKTKEVRVALFIKTVLKKNCNSLYNEVLDGYSWIAGDTKYTFKVDEITDKEVYKGFLTTDNYDILVMTAGGGFTCSETKWQINRPSVKFWRNKMIKFIKDGGGYYGVCGGTWFLLDFDKPPRTLDELKCDRASLGVSCVKLERAENPSGHILLSQFTGGYNTINAGKIYMYYSGWNFGPTRIYPGEIQFNVTINKNHSIFDDYLNKTALVGWSAGPRYVIPKEPDREVCVLANYPLEEFSDSERFCIHYWKYTGGIKGLVKGYLRHVKTDKSLIGINFYNTWWMASDWEKTDEIVKTNYSAKPIMTAEVYPNENNARIFLTGAHPEFKIFFGGEIFEVEDTNSNNLYDGLIGWTNYSDPDETEEDEEIYNWWIVRRAVAWAAKVPDNDLPPIYGPSQVSDIYPYNQSSNFTIYGNSVVADGVESLELFYRCSSDNGTTDPWSNWTLYGTDFDGSNGWSWEFNISNGTGYYQFYSIRHVKYGYNELVENALNKPDAIAYVKK